MAATYTSICLEDMQEVLKKEKGWVMFTPPGSEIYFEYTLKSNSNLHLVVYTTIMPQNKEARSCGADAIRVSVVYKDTLEGYTTGLRKFRRVHRTTGWRDNLVARVTEAYVYAKNIPGCPKCGRIMSVRQNKNTGESFLGCVGYNSKIKPCKHTRCVLGANCHE